jgi:glycosyltransferase involved in cell wall biosynthesis
VAEQAHALAGEVLLVFNTAPGALAEESHTALSKCCDRILFEPRVGKSNALNHAVVEAGGEVIAFTDDDAFPQPGWLAAITTPLLAPDRPPKLVGCGGPVVPRYPESGMPGWIRSLLEKEPTHFLSPRHDLGPVPREYSLDEEEKTVAPLGANCAYRREVFATHRYDPRLGPNRATGLRGGEDTLLGRALMRDGFRLRYCPDARVEHPVPAERMTLEFAERSYYLQGIEWVRLQRIAGFAPPRTRKLLWNLLRMRARSLYKRVRWGDARADSVRRLALKRARDRGALTEIWRPFADARPDAPGRPAPLASPPAGD